MDSASTLPTLRSIPPVRITKVIPSEMIPISETWRRMSVRLPSWKKMREPSCAVGLTITARITRTSKAIRLGVRNRRDALVRCIIGAQADFFAGESTSLPP